ncbi:MAG: fused MFS/spermidine synthase [bacterium]|nr:fused MFS/spermidine synthase [bacterium]
MFKTNKKILILALFFFSGFSALVYEIIWTRLMTLVFGTGIEAISAVISAFMFGLAIGSYFAGRHSDYVRKHLSAYAVTEVLIGLSSIVLYFLITYLPNFLSSFHSGIFADHDNIVISLIYILNFLLISIPATMMGATIPLVTKYFVTDKGREGFSIGLIYGLNTLGAVTGTILCGFYLIPAFGVMETNILASIISLSLGVTAFIIDREDRRKNIFNMKVFLSKSKLNIGFLKDPVISTVLMIFMISGFASMAYEVLWTRLLVMIVGNSTYAFSAILAVFLLGIAIGSFLIGRFIDGRKNLLLFFGILQILIFICAIAPLPFWDDMPFLFQHLYNKLYSGFFSLELITFIIVLLLILPPTIFMGGTFPVVNKIIMDRTTCIGNSVGATYSFNTVGGIFGSFIAGFYYIPELGVEKSILLVSALNLFAGLALILQTKDIGMMVKSLSVIVLGTFFAFFINWLPDWNQNILNRGFYVYADLYRDNFKESKNLKSFLEDRYGLRWIHEGRIGTVAVTQVENHMTLQVNGKTEGGTFDDDMKTQTMVAALPLMVRGRAEKVAIIGLGTGVSLGVAEQFSPEYIDCIELSKDVVHASTFFKIWNHDSLNYSGLNMILADGRNYLTYTDEKYDVIINEPSNPWITGVSNLFTREFFQIASERLNRGGIMAQWLQIYNLKTEDVKILIKTFKEVFPYVSVWMYTSSDIIVMGSMDHEFNDFKGIVNAFYAPPVRSLLKNIGIDKPSDVMRGYLFGSEKASIFTRGSKINSDNYPVIEFEAPKRLYSIDAQLNNIKALRGCC